MENMTYEAFTQIIPVLVITFSSLGFIIGWVAKTIVSELRKGE